MKELDIGDLLPDFSVDATGGLVVHSKQLLGKKIVFYFYPRDATPGCTLEGQRFRDHVNAFERCGASIFGVSRDSLKSHERFKAKQDFPFPLIADEDSFLCNLFNVIREKNMYGKKVWGIERSTFLFDEGGVLRQVWRKVKVSGHVEAVLEAVQAL